MLAKDLITLCVLNLSPNSFICCPSALLLQEKVLVQKQIPLHPSWMSFTDILSFSQSYHPYSPQGCITEVEEGYPLIAVAWSEATHRLQVSPFIPPQGTSAPLLCLILLYEIPSYAVQREENTTRTRDWSQNASEVVSFPVPAAQLTLGGFKKKLLRVSVWGLAGSQRSVPLSPTPERMEKFRSHKKSAGEAEICPSWGNKEEAGESAPWHHQTLPVCSTLHSCCVDRWGAELLKHLGEWKTNWFFWFHTKTENRWDFCVVVFFLTGKQML